MTLSYYIYKYPYKILWFIHKILKMNSKIVFYCADPLDYEMFIPIQKHLPDIPIVAKNKKTKDYLKKKNIKYKNMPVFPDSVIMARHMPYKFPVIKIVKFGFDHGLYQFKKWTSSKYYNQFDIYFVSSNEQVKKAKEMGITTTKAIGYPKLDNAFNGIYNENYLRKIKDDLNLDPQKKTIIFTSTWNVDGLSALDRWIDKVHLLTEKYNILITVHTWTLDKYKTILKQIDGTVYLDKFDVTPYLMISDIFVGDYNSLIGEFCALDKPMITFSMQNNKKTLPGILEMLANISIQIDDFEMIFDAIKDSLLNPDKKSHEREMANQILFQSLDGKAGQRAATEIRNLLKKRNLII
ncbi:MAG: CDP-glycerol glycerophosphotransferase family protein [Candidatus Cloacimonetes bacterium]|nr:CDP-glycerol glycerophosphotransferase family protein [Candidatus Cloacimonadota bacterium]